MKKLLIWISWWLIDLGSRVLRPLNDDQLKEKRESVGKFIYEYMPLIDKRYEGQVIVENARINYFSLPSGELPAFDYYLPSLRVYIVVGGVESSPWPEARLRGVSREKWEVVQIDLSALEERLPRLPVLADTQPPVLLLVRWCETVSNVALSDRLTRLRSGHVDS